MATLSKHHGIQAIYTHGNTRYAVTKDNKVLKNIGGTGWKLSQISPGRLAEVASPDSSSAAQAIITRANRAAEYHDRDKRIRRLRR